MVDSSPSSSSYSSSSSSDIIFSESQNSVDVLLEGMDEQINDLNKIVKDQKDEIKQLQIRIQNLKNILQSNLSEYLNNIICYI